MADGAESTGFDSFTAGLVRDVRDDITALRGELAGIRHEALIVERDLKLLAERHASDIDLLNGKLADIGRPNWVAIAASVAFAAFVLPAAWFVINAFVENRIEIATSRISVNTEIIHQLQTTLDDLSKHVSDADNRVADKLAEEIASRRTQYAANRVSLTEIETQFKSASDIANLRAVQQERFNAIIWQKYNPGESYPLQMFFPNTFGAAPDNTAAPESPPR